MEISAKVVKELREKTGAGMMDCKQALTESDGDFEKATELLRRKGLAVAAKRADRAAKEGLIETYIHAGGKLGVMVEVNCETDFVARSDEFKAFAHDIAMHIAAANPMVIKRESVPADVLEKERNLYRQQALDAKKPEKIIDKIIEGKVDKYFKEICLLEQQFVKNPDVTIEQILQDLIGKIGENIKISRFVRFRLGETAGN